MALPTIKQISQKILKFLVVCIVFMLILLYDVSRQFRNSVKNQSSSGCGRYPTNRDIHFNNITWQVFEIPKGPIYLLNAYLDERRNETIVRVNLIGPKIDNKEDKIYCHFWYNHSDEGYVVPAHEFIHLGKKGIQI